jgi:UDP-glucose:(heptosyl)LPS alpha-1,3-glucosyltransferase
LHATDGIWTVLSGCDVAVLPTYYDPCSRFTLEALAAGKPVITTRFNGASERFEHLRHGYIVDNPNNVADLADAITHFCDPEKIQLAHKAIVADNLKNEVSIQKHVEQLIELYDAVMAKKKSEK